MTGMYRHTQLFSVEMESYNFFLFKQDWLQTEIILISASQKAKMTDLCYHPLEKLFF
jgi:hypothetical protein